MDPPTVHSLRALTWLLVLLVLVPAGVLAWLGYRSAGALDEAVDASIRADLTEAARAIREAATAEARALESRLTARFERLAEDLGRDAPIRGLPVAMQTLLAGLPTEVRVRDVRLLDASGRSIWPAAWDPDAPASSSPRDELLFDLRRRADRLRFGDGDPDAAVGTWREAAEKAGSTRLHAAALAEAALLEARLGRVEAAAVHASLLDAFTAAQREAAKRPLTLLLAHAAGMQDRAAACALAERWARGEVAQVPLTDVERAGVRGALHECRGAGFTHPGIPPGLEGPLLFAPWAVPVEPPPPPRLEIPAPGGSSLVATFDADAIWEGMQDGLESLSWGRVEVRVLPWADLAYGAVPGIRLPQDAAPDVPHLELDGPLGVPGFAWYWHRDADAAREERAVRRRATLVGVLGLLAVTVVGLVLVRRAVRRERDARQLRDDFIANVSHELRTPLTSVCLHAEMLADEDPPADRRRELAGVVKAEGGRLAALVDDLLDFAALEQGVRRIEPEPVDLARAVREAAAPYETLAAREGVDLEVDVPDGELAALADAHALSRILANLLSNAWRHGRPSKDGAPGRLRIRAYDDERSTEGPTVEVQDDGPGIPADERRTVFERFHRGRQSRRVEGTGLGLALGRELARAMDGNLELVDDPACTVFRLTLPPVPELPPVPDLPSLPERDA